VIDAVFDYIFNIGPRRMAEVWTHNTGIVHWQYMPNSPRENGGSMRTGWCII